MYTANKEKNCKNLTWLRRGHLKKEIPVVDQKNSMYELYENRDDQDVR